MSDLGDSIHFQECAICGQDFDKRDFGAVVFHGHTGFTESPGFADLERVVYAGFMLASAWELSACGQFRMRHRQEPGPDHEDLHKGATRWVERQRLVSGEWVSINKG